MAFDHDPSAEVMTAFRRIAQSRMASLPICNPALSVEAAACTRWQGDWILALVTPWALNLMALPGASGRFQPLSVGQSQEWDFPSGRYTFLGHEEPGLGCYQSCSLFSPAFEFASQQDAVAVARGCLAGLLQPVDDEHPQIEAARLAGIPPNARPMTRRGFLRGVFGAPAQEGAR